MAISTDLLPQSHGEAALRVVLAQPRGFCAGVVRAIDIVERALDLNGAPVYVRHEIVHNRHVVDRLRGKGAVFVEELDEIPAGALTVFSAHGVSRSVQDEAKLRHLPTLDATCPLVTKVHLQGRRYAKAGRVLVLVGHAGHAEVIGTMGQVDAPMHLVSTVDDVTALPIDPDTPIAYVTQTTLSVDDTRTVIAALHDRFADVEGPDVSEDLLRHAESPDSGARAGGGERPGDRGRIAQQLQFQPTDGDRHGDGRAQLSGR